MTTITGLSIAIFIALSQLFQQGLAQLQNKQYAAAVTSFTGVCERDVPGNTFRPMALYFRAQAYLGENQRDAALADLATILREAPEPGLVKAVEVQFAALGGDPALTLPTRGPGAVWAAFWGKLQQGQLDQAGDDAMPGMRQQLNADPTSVAALTQTILRSTSDRVVGLIIDYAANPKSCLALVSGPGYNLGRVDLALADGQWRVASVQRFDFGHDSASTWARLVQLGLLLPAYAQDHQDRYPATLDELVRSGIARRADILCASTDMDKEQLFHYCPGLTPNDGDKIVAAAPTLTKSGKRWVLYGDGRVVELADAAFLAQAASQHWQTVAAYKKGELTTEQRTRIEALVRQLGDDHYTVREAAFQRLRELGDVAIPFVQPLANSTDPELRSRAQALLQPTAPPAAAAAPVGPQGFMMQQRAFNFQFGN